MNGGKTLLTGLFFMACTTRPTDPAQVSPSPAAAAPPIQSVATTPSSSAPTMRSSPHDIHHVLATGQSNAIGTMATPALSLSQPFDNLMFDTGVLRAESDPIRKLVPLVEGDVIPTRVYPVETMSSGFANLVSQMARDRHFRHDVLVSAHGVGGLPYPSLRKGTQPYESGMTEVKRGIELAKAAGKSYVVTAVTIVHGEADHQDGNPLYEPGIRQWQRDYEKDVQALTGQTAPIPLFQTQISNWPRYGSQTSKTPGDQLTAAIKSGGKVVLVGPKYHLPYVADGIHLTNEGQRHMGEDYAKAYRRVVLEGGVWEPVRPKNVVRDGTTITVTFHVPVPPLVLDTTLVLNPGDFGFEAVVGGVPAKIASVTLPGPDTVKVTLASEPAAKVRLRYAFTSRPGVPAGPTTGPRGNLRDSDPTPSRHGYPLFNWCIHFDEAVP